MDANVSWMLELTVRAGREADFKALMAEMVHATESTEPGAMDYEWNISADGRECHLFERYRDSAATMIHLAAFGQNFAERFLGILEPTRFVVYGSPNQEVKDALAAFNPTYMTSRVGFTR